MSDRRGPLSTKSNQYQKIMDKLLETGLSGWIIFIISLIIGGGGLTVHHFRKQQTKQSKIKAGGDVAGGDIIKTYKEHSPEHAGSTKEKKKTIQKDITANGDVAGGNIFKKK
ncbi:MAG: hypothetical protein WGN25_19000 [Candidatus Electrothrix sp. GW3-4]|uniref:hypothetical protein n=1 Tax=Candidatus Electrothrix sp. GW3-4 TaxID=3126740 RepID=UPI0030D3A9CD